MTQQPENHNFALSLHDLDFLIDSSAESLQISQEKTTTIPKDANLKQYLPSHYHDFLDVFDRDQANQLPPHRSWDHPIELQSHSQPPISRLYSMNQHELKSLRENIDKELEEGFIRVSSSPAAASVRFDKKPNGDL